MKAFDIVVDADNTLWDTDALYADAQLWLISAVEDAIGVKSAVVDRLAFLRILDQTIAESHRAGLRYPTRLLVRGLESLLQDDDFAKALRAAYQSNPDGGLSNEAVIELEKEFYRRLALQPSLRNGVAEGLNQLAGLGLRIVCLTENAKAKCAKNLHRSGLEKHFCRVLEARKDMRLFARLRTLTPNPICVIGDQLSKDIVPARSAGLFTIYFPGNFRPKWEALYDENSNVAISSFAEVPGILAKAEFES